MDMDVSTEIEINRPRSEVASYASDPDDISVGRHPRRRHADAASQSGQALGLRKMAAPMMKAAMQRANNKDLALLKKILEQGSGRRPALTDQRG